MTYIIVPCGNGQLTCSEMRSSYITLSGMLNISSSIMVSPLSILFMSLGWQMIFGIYKYVVITILVTINMLFIVNLTTRYNIQSSSPKGAKPFCFIMYTDKTNLSSFGTAKG